MRTQRHNINIGRSHITILHNQHIWHCSSNSFSPSLPKRRTKRSRLIEHAHIMHWGCAQDIKTKGLCHMLCNMFDVQMFKIQSFEEAREQSQYMVQWPFTINYFLCSCLRASPMYAVSVFILNLARIPCTCLNFLSFACESSERRIEISMAS